MVIAIISDIHSNLEALTAVLSRIDSLPVETVYCLGDVVGYNADPEACVNLVLSRVRAVIRGNHDKAVAGFLNLDWFNHAAREAALWTRKSISSGTMELVKRLPEGPLDVGQGILLCHGTPYDEDEYLTDERSISRSFACLDADHPEARFCFNGHTHFPLVVSRKRGSKEPEIHAEKEKIAIEDGVTYLINPGSVGQPRDGNALASFGILDLTGRVYSNLRVPYRIEETQRKIRQARLPDVLAVRLGQGR
jgi:diadenosine tetraphosphatase ApaH/serine/threonine PP2A family protein phosphatase